MKKNEVQIGGVYSAKVNDRVVHVRIDAENRSGGWDATNLATNKKVRIKTVQRLREKISGPTGQPATPDEPEATAPAARPETPRRRPEGEEDPQGQAGRRRPGRGQREEDELHRRGRPRADRGRRTAERQADDRGDHDQGVLDQPRRQDAPRHLYSAIIREITVKGADARFRKTERGKFAVQNA